jgi:hypothetical protein
MPTEISENYRPPKPRPKAKESMNDITDYSEALRALRPVYQVKKDRIAYCTNH